METSETVSLYERCQPTVWLFLAGDKSVFTGFCVEKGLLMTCRHGFGKEDDILARRLDNTVKFRKATLVKDISCWDLSLFRVDGVDEDFVVAPLADSGVLDEGETLFGIHNSSGACGSFSSGRVCFRCIDKPKIPRGYPKSKNHELNNSITPSYRTMGYIYNRAKLEEYEARAQLVPSEEFRQELERFRSTCVKIHQDVPIIQMANLATYHGASGCPIFNGKGEVVGCHVSFAMGFSIAVHLSLLKKILDSASSEN